MKLVVNGEARRLPEGAVLIDLLESMGVEDQRGLAVAIDRTVIPRGQWQATALAEGQRVEILRAVQGG